SNDYGKRADSSIWRRMFLVRGGGFQSHDGREDGGLRLHGWSRGQAYVPPGVRRRYGPRGGGASHVRSKRSEFSRFARRLFRGARSHHLEPAGQRCGRAVPFCNFLHDGRAAGAGRAIHCRAGNSEDVSPAHCDRRGTRVDLLSRRGLSPGVLRQQPHPAILPVCYRAQAAQVRKKVLAKDASLKDEDEAFSKTTLSIENVSPRQLPSSHGAAHCSRVAVHSPVLPSADSVPFMLFPSTMPV